MISKEFIILNKTTLSTENFQSIKNDSFNKPMGGLWASPYELDTRYISDWHRFCDESALIDAISNDSISLKLKEMSNIFIIEDQKDLINLVNLVGIEESIMARSVRSTICPDFEKASMLFDAIYLTKNGLRHTRSPIDNYKYNLYSWDCESILILNFNCIEMWKYKKLDII